MKNFQIIGITGTIGAGKGTIANHLVKKHKFLHLSVRKYLTQKLQDTGKPINRENMSTLANDLRANNSPKYLAMELYKLAVKSQQNCIIESLRTVGEIEALKKQKNFLLWAIDAPINLRYERILNRASKTDTNLTFEEFKKQELLEWKSTDPTKQNLSACINLADHTFLNTQSLENLTSEVTAELKNNK